MRGAGGEFLAAANQAGRRVPAPDKGSGELTTIPHNLTEGEARFLEELSARGRFRALAATVLATLGVAVAVLMDWRAVGLGLDLDATYWMVSVWGGVMLVPVALLLAALCVCLAGRARGPVAAGCLVLGLLAAGVFGVSATYYARAIGMAGWRAGGELYEPGPWVVTLGDPVNNPVALGILTALATGALALLAVRTLPAGSEIPAELRGWGGVRARVTALRRSLVLNPVRLFFGPIFERDVRITGRHRSTYVYRAVYPAVLLGITAIAFMGMSHSLTANPQGGRVAELQALQRLAPQLTYAVAWAQFGLLLVIAPVLTAPSLCDEKRSRTLGSLLTTPLSNLQIVLGKLASRMVHVVILVAASTPLLLAARVFGGVEAEVIVGVLAITLTASLMAASMGIHFSVIHKRPATAAVGGILATGAVLMLPLVGLFVYAMQSAGPPSSVLVWASSAPVALACVLFGTPAATVDTTGVWVLNSVLNVAVAALACVSSAVSLRKIMLREVVNEGAALKALGARARRRARKAAATGAAAPVQREAAPEAGAAESAEPAGAGEDAGGSRTVSDRPVLWRELRQSTLGSRFKLLVAVVGILLCGAFMYSRMQFWEPELHMAVAGIALFAICLQSTVASTGTISSERESQAWETLMTTPLTGRQVIAGKFMGALKRMWLAGAVLAAHFAVAMALGYVHPVAVVEVMALAVSAAAMLCATGLLLSLVLRRSTAAAIGNLGFAGVLWIGVPLLTVFCLEAFGVGSRIEDLCAGYLACSNPVVLGIFAVSGAVWPSAWQWSAPIYDDFIWNDATPWDYARYVAVACVTALTVAAACLVLAERLFLRLSGRSS